MSELTEEKARRQLAWASLGGVLLIAAVMWGGYKLVQSDKTSQTAEETKTQATDTTPSTVDPEGPNPYASKESETEPQDETQSTVETPVKRQAAGQTPLPTIQKPNPVNEYTWIEVDSNWAPVHPIHGPKQVELYSTDFAQTPEGAALTFIHTYFRINGAGPESYRPQIESHIATSEIEKQIEIAAHMHENYPETGDVVFMGWDVEQYTSDAIRLSIYAANPRNFDDDYVVFPVDLTWDGNTSQWKIITPAQGTYIGIVQKTDEAPDFDLSDGLR